METNIAPPEVPSTVPPAAPKKWYEIWWAVWRHPGTATFQAILNEWEAGSSNGYKYVALAGLIAALVSVPFTMSSQNTTQNVIPNFWPISMLCGVVLVPIFAAIWLAITAGIYHGIARLFHGNGDRGELVYCFAVVQAPATLLTSVIGLGSTLLISSSPQAATLLTCLLAVPSLVVGIYTIILYICAISAVENTGTGASTAVYSIPVVIILILFVCITAVIVLLSPGRVAP